MKIIAIEEHFSLDVVEQAINRERSSPASAAARASGPMAAQLARLSDVGDGRLRDMDAAGITLQVLSLVAPATQGLDPATAVPVARQANDILADAVHAHPDRFAGFATLPTPDPCAAASELERAVTSLGFKGAMIHGTTHGRFLDDPAFWPIFAAAEHLDVPIYLHPAEPPATVRDAYYAGFAPAVSFGLATAALGWHVETGLHVLRLILAGVFDRFPRLQLIIGHMGEALPFFLARSTTRLSPAITQLPRTIEDYVRAHVCVTTSGFFTVPPLLSALLTFGADRIIFSVDYPFSTNDEARRFLDTAPLSPDDKEKLAHANAERLLKL
jgi:predicted TIM-barrel fold metal-dependent hydrolase